MAELKFIVTLDSSQFKQGASQVVADVKQISNEVKKEGGKMQKEFDTIGKSVGNSIGKYLAAFGGAAMFKQLVTEVARVRSEFQKTEVAIETLLGSKEKADALMSEVKDIAAKSPLELGDITRATQQMISFNIEAEKVPQYLRAIGDISMGEKDKFQSLSLAFSQMSASGKLMGQDLLQMINAGFNPLATMAEKTGKSIGELKDEMSKGAITAEMVQQAFIDATSAGGKFYNMSENASKTLAGQYSMLQDAISRAMNEVGESTEGLMMGAVQALTSLINNYETVIKVVAVLAANYGVYRAAVALATATEAAHSAMQVVATVRTILLEKAQAALNAVMSVNPYVAAAMALSSLVSVLYLAASGESNVERATREANEALEQQAQDLEDRKAKINSLIQVIKNTASTEYDRINAYEQLKVLAPELTKEYDKEAIALLDLNDAQKAVNEEINNAEYQNTIDQIGLLTKKIEEYEERIKELNREAERDPRQKDSIDDRITTIRIWEQEAKTQLKVYQDNLERMQSLYRQAREEAKPIELRIEEAEENKNVRQSIVDFFDGLLVAAKSVDDAAGHINFDSAVANFDTYIKQVEKEVEDLKQRVEKDPMNMHLQLEYQEKQRVLNEFINWRNDLDRTGATTITLRITAVYDEAVGALNNTINKLRGLVGSKDNNKPRTKKDIQADIDATQAELDGLSKEEAMGRRGVDLKKKIVAHKKELQAYDVPSVKVSAPKKVKSGTSKKDTAEEEARQRAEQIQQERRLAEERQQMWRDADDALRAAKIAAIKDDGQRERAEEDEQHRLRLRDIRLQGEEFAKQEYENRKKAWEITHKKGAFEDTEEGKAGWEAIELTPDQIKLIAAQVDAEESAYERILEKRAQADVEAMRNYLKAYGTYQEQRLAIEQEYDDKIAKARNDGERLMLIKQKEDDLEQLERNFGMRSQQMADLFEDASDKSVKAIDNIIKKYEALVTFMKGVTGEDVQTVTVDDLIGLGFSEEDIKKVQTGEIKIADITERIKGLKDELNNKSPFIAFANELDKAISKIGKGNIGEGVEGIGNAVTKFLPKVKEFGETITSIFGMKDSALQNVIDAVGGLGEAAAGVGQAMSGDIVGGVMAAAGGISKIVSSIGGLFGADYASYERLMEQYERLIDVWDDLLDKKKEYLDQSYGAEAMRTEKEITAILEKETEAWRELGKERLNAGASAGSHSIGKRIINSLKSSDWEDITKVLGQDARKLLGERLTGLFDLSSDQLSRLKEQAPAFWAKMDDDVQKYLQGIIDGAEQLEEVQQAAKDRLTQTTFDAVKSDFISKLADMTTAAKDFSDDFAEMLFKAMLNTKVEEMFSDRLDRWYDNFADAMKDSEISESERNALLSDYNAIVDDAMKLRDTLAEAAGYGGEMGEGSGAYSAVASFSQEQGDELNGRLTAIQIGQERNNLSLLMAVASLQEMTVVSTANAATLTEMRNILLISNGHLEDIVRYTKLTSQHSALLDEIATKIKNL